LGAGRYASRTTPERNVVEPINSRRIGEFWGNLKTRTFAEVLMDREEDRTLRAVLVGMLRKSDG
jgi:ribosomal protein L13